VTDRAGSLRWSAGRFALECGQKTLVMGVVNVTPDSFSDGGRFLDPPAAVVHGVSMAEGGADVLDVGGESTRPGAEEVGPGEEAARVLPVIRALVKEVAVPISVDTRRAAVAVAALEAGASIVNDVSGGADPDLVGAVRDAESGYVVMHMRGVPATMRSLATYGDVVEDVRAELGQRLAAALDRGVEADRIVVDPGIGFAKEAEQNLALLRDVEAFAALGRPVLVGASRKAFVGRVLDADVGDRLEGSLAVVAWLVSHGVQIVRVHDVRVIEAIRDGGPVADVERSRESAR
jgi:dihydropteroate synthase